MYEGKNISSLAEVIVNCGYMSWSIEMLSVYQSTQHTQNIQQPWFVSIKVSNSELAAIIAHVQLELQEEVEVVLDAQ